MRDNVLVTGSQRSVGATLPRTVEVPPPHPVCMLRTCAWLCGVLRHLVCCVLRHVLRAVCSVRKLHPKCMLQCVLPAALPLRCAAWCMFIVCGVACCLLRCVPPEALRPVCDDVVLLCRFELCRRPTWHRRHHWILGLLFKSGR